MNRKENNNNLVEEESLRKKFKSNDENGNDNDEPIGENEEEEEGENLEEPMPDTDLDLDSEQSKHEQLFGIKARINNNFKRFQAVLKKINSDFIVYEINREGQVARLTSFDLPEKKQASVEEDKPDKKAQEERIKVILGEEKFAQLHEFLLNDTRNDSFKLEAPSDKTERKLLHEFIKSNYKQFVSNTANEPSGKQLIEIYHQKYAGAKANSRDVYKSAPNANRPMSEFKYTECVMYKEGIDTIQAINLLAKHLRIKHKRIGFAGTKDKLAKTCQYVSFFKIEPDRLAKLNSHFHNVKLGNFKMRNGDALKLGDLQGNRFKLVLRELSETDDMLIEQGVDSMRQHGFVNYFGLQRFGNCVQIPTHSIGRCLLQNKIKEAIELILKPRVHVKEREEVRQARDLWNQFGREGAKQALACIQNINCVEKFLLSGLNQSNKNDYLGAFQFLPRNMRLMYLHAYQSYIWNEAVSERLNVYSPTQPCIGDLVLMKSTTLVADSRGKKEECKVLVLDEQNLSDYSIEDVVLPLPGHSVIYPNNQIKDFYEKLLAKDGIRMEDFRNKIKDFSLGGDYRQVIVKPKDLKHDIINYEHELDEISKSDWDLLKPKTNEIAESCSQSNKHQVGKRKALQIEFSLPSSSYATIALREILQ